MVSSYAAVLFALRMGLAPGPAEQAAASLRDETLAVATAYAEVQAPRDDAIASVSWRAPPKYALSREDWRRMLDDALRNETIANAAMWLAAQPVHVSLSGDRFFVALRFQGP
jgi:hypothetical protein